MTRCCPSQSVSSVSILIPPQPLYNTIVGVQDNFRVSYPICAISRVKCIVSNDHLGSSTDSCCIQNCVITNHVIKRLRCITVKPVLSDHVKQDMFLAFQTGGHLLLNESSAESFRYFHSTISNHLSITISMSPEWTVAKTGLTVLPNNKYIIVLYIME